MPKNKVVKTEVKKPAEYKDIYAGKTLGGKVIAKTSITTISGKEYIGIELADGSSTILSSADLGLQAE